MKCLSLICLLALVLSSCASHPPDTLPPIDLQTIFELAAKLAAQDDFQANLDGLKALGAELARLGYDVNADAGKLLPMFEVAADIADTLTAYYPNGFSAKFKTVLDKMTLCLKAFAGQDLPAVARELSDVQAYIVWKRQY